MQKRVIVNGARGKMGGLAVDTLSSHPAFDVVAMLGREDDLQQAIIATKADIVVDLTRADCVYANAHCIIEAGARPVIGTSGLLEDQVHSLTNLCEVKKLGGIIVPNFSIGAVLMMHFAAIAAKWFSEVEIVESHHQQKLDAPSGSAMKTAEMIAAARKKQKNVLALKELVGGARGAVYQDINIHSLRLPGVLARQEVIFGNTGETLSILHNSIDRVAYMPGLIIACEYVQTIDFLCYGLEKALGL